MTAVSQPARTVHRLMACARLFQPDGQCHHFRGNGFTRPTRQYSDTMAGTVNLHYGDYEKIYRIYMLPPMTPTPKP